MPTQAAHELSVLLRRPTLSLNYLGLASAKPMAENGSLHSHVHLRGEDHTLWLIDLPDAVAVLLATDQRHAAVEPCSAQAARVSLSSLQSPHFIGLAPSR